MSTSYLVLDKTDPDGEWSEVGRYQARSARSAISLYLSEHAVEDDVSTFVAVPARSWKPVTVKVETKTALKFS